MNSVWTETAELMRHPPLEGKITTDVLIIGGGMAGLLCAYKMKEAGIDCTLAEAGHICGGVTKNTTAKVTLQHGAIFDRMLHRFGRELTSLYLQANREALEEYKALATSLDFEWETCDHCVYFRTDRRGAEREARALEACGIAVDLLERVPLPLPVAGGVRVEGQGMLHPLKLADSLSRHLRIFEGTRVKEIRGHTAITPRGQIGFQKAVVATHFPFLNRHGLYFLKQYQHRSYVIALENAPLPSGMYLDADPTGLSFRRQRELLLLGGGAHRTGKEGGNWRALEDFARVAYPGARVTHRWATQDCMTLDDIPYIGQYARTTPDLYVATGFGKWGMTTSLAAASLLCDLVRDRKNPYARVFSPTRSMLRPQLAVNAGEALMELLRPTVPRCPHMGCALHYNAQERSWDCACHGSRFSETGALLDNPATHGKRIR